MKTAMRILPGAGTRSVITIENNYLRMLEIKGKKIVRWSSCPLPAGVVQEGSVADSRQFQAALAAFIGNEKVSPDASISFPSNRVLFRTVMLPRMKKKLMGEAVDREARRELPVNIEDLYLFSQTYISTKDAQSVLLVGVQKDPYDRLFRAIFDTPLKPKEWELKPLALTRAVGLSNAVILDIQQSSADLIVVANGVPELVRSLVMQVGLSQSERAVALAREVSQSVDYFKANEAENAWDPETPLVVTGALADDSALMEKLKELSVLLLKPFTCPFNAPETFPHGSFASAIGVAMKKGHSSVRKNSATPIDFSVLPRQYQPTPFPVRRVAAGAGIMAAALMVLPAYQASASNDSRLSQGRAELVKAQRQVTFARANLSKQSQMQKKIEDALSLSSGIDKEKNTIFASQLHVSDDMWAALINLPPQVSLRKLAVNGNSVSFEGEAAYDQVVIEYVKSLEANGRFPKISITSMARASGNANATAFVLSVDRRQRQ